MASHMGITRRREVRIYQTVDGKIPYAEWNIAIVDKATQTRIDRRVARLREGNFGDVSSVGDGVSELRLHFGAGYRVYFGQQNDSIIILLCGGDKGSQKRDIKTAKTYWKDFLKRSAQ